MDTTESNVITNQSIWMVPIGRNPEFVGRKSMIEALKGRLEPKSDFVRIAVLCGLGEILIQMTRFQISIQAETGDADPGFINRRCWVGFQVSLSSEGKPATLIFASITSRLFNCIEMDGFRVTRSL